ncbi:P-loop containing nucleoside triphosphate hydrolase protein [Hymenopellis radicata]|nr:P-loop containing nucleoside triphosphate hydrolase protein [Hymenopellis radicata]
MELPYEISSLLRLLSSFTAFREGIIFMIFGFLLEIFRRASFRWSTELYNKLFIRVTFDEQEPCYQWMLVWLSKQPMWSNSRDISIGTQPIGIEWGSLGPDNPDDDEELRDLTYLPTVMDKTQYSSSPTTYSTWFKGHYISVERFKPNSEGRFSLVRSPESIQISILTRNHHILKDLLREARKEYQALRAARTDVYATGSTIHSDYHSWALVSSGPKRSLDSIILEPGLKSFLLNNARSFLDSKKWYTERGIPFRRGYLLYGAPGSGKTSFIAALAGELCLDIFVISLSQRGLDDSSLAKFLNKLPERCIALIEDIDAAFSTTLNRDDKAAKRGVTDPDESDSEYGDDVMPTVGTSWNLRSTGMRPGGSLGNVTLSGLLNALDGIGAKQGRILFATTNKYESLDEALSRPGRMDVHVEFKLAAKYQARELFLRFYNPRYSADCDVDEVDTNSQESKESACTLQTSVPSSVTVVGDTGDGKDLQFSMSELRKLADEFAKRLPDHVVSMASLQGYLMENKTNPNAALSGIKAWIEKETRSTRDRPPTKRKSSGGTAIASGGDCGVEFDSDISPFTRLLDVDSDFEGQNSEPSSASAVEEHGHDDLDNRTS